MSNDPKISNAYAGLMVAVGLFFDLGQALFNALNLAVTYGNVVAYIGVMLFTIFPTMTFWLWLTIKGIPIGLIKPKQTIKMALPFVFGIIPGLNTIAGILPDWGTAIFLIIRSHRREEREMMLAEEKKNFEEFKSDLKEKGGVASKNLGQNQPKPNPFRNTARHVSRTP